MLNCRNFIFFSIHKCSVSLNITKTFAVVKLLKNVFLLHDHLRLPVKAYTLSFAFNNCYYIIRKLACLVKDLQMKASYSWSISQQVNHFKTNLMQDGNLYRFASSFVCYNEHFLGSWIVTHPLFLHAAPWKDIFSFHSKILFPSSLMYSWLF